VNESTDAQLLRAYTEQRSEAAFGELVRRHVDLVYSAARRMVCDSHLAEDVTQGTFVALARSAPQLTGRAVLSGWLHRTAQNIAAQTVRTDVRRRAREQEAAAMNELLAGETDATWEQVAPHLDAALGEMTEPDRDALMLRYFERKSAREMATLLGLSDDTAQKRVTRAVEKLREKLMKRGVTVGAGGLVVLISGNAILIAPAGLSAAITVGAVTAAATTIAGTAAIITMTAFQKTAILSALALAIGFGIFEMNQAATERARARSLAEQNAALSNQLAGLARATVPAADQAGAGGVAKARQDATELARLRNEVTRLRAEARVAGQEPASPPETASPADVITFKSAARASVPWGQAVATGGWKTPQGKRAFVFVTPHRVAADGNNDLGAAAPTQLEIQSTTAEIPEADVPEILWRLRSDHRLLSETVMLTAEQLADIRTSLTNHAGSGLVSNPSVIILNNRQASVLVTDSPQSPSAAAASPGSQIDFIPSVSDDGQAVLLTVIAELRYHRAPLAGAQ